MLALFLGTILIFVGVRYGVLIAVGTASGTVWRKAIEASAGVQFCAVVVAAVTLLLAYAGAVRCVERRRAVELVLAYLPVQLLAGLFVGGMVMTVAIFVQHVNSAVTIKAIAIRSVLTAVTESVKSGIFEETLLCLVVFRLLWRVSNAWVALALSALLFGLIHLLNPNSSLFAAICIAFEAGVLLAAFYILTGRIWMSIGVHAGWNFTQGWVFGAAVSGAGDFAGGPVTTQPVAGVPAWQSGGQFGPEASIYTLLICTALGVAVLMLAGAQGKLRASWPGRDGEGRT